MGLIILIIIGFAIFYIFQQSKKKSAVRSSELMGSVNSKSTIKTTKTEKNYMSIQDTILNSPSSLVSQQMKLPNTVNSQNRPSNPVSIPISQSIMQNRSLKDDSEDNLVTFTISVGRPEQKSSNKTPGRWIKQGEYIQLKKFNSNKGFFYFGGQLDAYQTNAYYNSYATEASLIDESLPIEYRDQYYTDDSLDYWPKYIDLSPAARGAYLNWLFGERDDPETPIGYVFIYFYGLERRVLIDGTKGQVDDCEYISIFNELKRLRQIFADNYAFHNYSSKLIEILAYLKPNILKLDYSEYSNKYDSILFKYHLAKQVHEGIPITAELALLWIKNTDEYSLRTPARRCSEEFSTLFKERYLEETKGGLLVKPNKTKLHLGYSPASSTLRGFKLDPVDLPDPSILKAPIKKLAAIADECTDELEQYSRYLGRKGTTKKDIEALLLLPKTLKAARTDSLLNDFKLWANAHIKDHNGLVLFSELWNFTGKPLPEKLNKKELDLLGNFLSSSNYYYAPNILIHKSKPSIDGYIVLSHHGISCYQNVSSSFNLILLFIRLASLIATSDNDFHAKEQAFINQMIDQDEELSSDEKTSLKAYFLWNMNTPANTAGLKQQIESMDESNKINFRKILIQIALADGKIEASEIKQLEKLYTMLSIDKSLIPSDLHRYGTQKNADREQPSTLQNDASFSLNKTILAQHEADTKEVQTLLGTIFTEDTIADEIIEPTNLNPALSTALDKQHNELFEILINKEKWLREELESLCEKLNLMSDGAIETINDWAYEIVDAPVLEDDGDIYVDHEIVAELKGE